MKVLLIVLLASATSGCVQAGNFCEVYVPADMGRAGATALVTADRGAAERIAINEETYKGCS